MKTDRSEFEATVKECHGCKLIREDNTCRAYVYPRLRWRHFEDGTGFVCWLATHHSHAVVDHEQAKKRVGQQKTRKRM